MTDFSGALATWRGINLSNLQKTLDEQGVQMVDHQKESVIGRKALSDMTKEFKKIPDNEKLTAFKGLLKAYQSEIDNLTKRCKTSENAFLNVYKVLAEAPDPYPLLEAAVDQTVKVAEAHELQAQVKQLREENTELRRKVSESTTLESAKVKAEAKVAQLENTMQELVQEKASQKENELHATYDERIRNFEEREKDLHRQITVTKNQLLDLRMSNESNQAKLLNQTHRQDQEVVAKLAEVDMIVADLERANTRVATVERRNELLRAEIESMRSGNESSDKVRSLESQINDLQNAIDRMNGTMESQKSVSADKENSFRKTLDDLNRDLAHKNAELEQLRSRIKQYHDYDEIKRELEIMKYVEFAGLEEEDSLSDGESDLRLPDPNAEKANAQYAKSLEALLATKNKKLLDELTKIRILRGELEASVEDVRAKLDTTTAELERQRKLNNKLENDLLSLNNKPTNGDASSASALAPSASDGSGSDIVADLDRAKQAPDNGEGAYRTTPIPFTNAASPDSSILPIVTSQRDRFRQRNTELEEELRKQFQVLSEMRAEVKNLQSDNLKLYEKVRYMQSYREEGLGTRPLTSQLDPLPSASTSRSATTTGGGQATAQTASASPFDFSKYSARYEQAMNPFEAFRGREATRAYHSLNILERGVLTLTQGILGNRRTRTFFIIYAIALHLLVLFASYECSASSSSYIQVQQIRT